MSLNRFQHVLAIVVALFVLGASSQAAVCELACGLQVHPAACHAAMDAESSSPASAMPGMTAQHAAMDSMAGMSHEHCSHGMTMSALPGIAHSLNSLADGACGHTAVSAFETGKAGTSSVSFAAVQWVAVAMVPIDLTLPVSYASVGKRPPLVPGGVDPLVDRLRI